MAQKSLNSPLIIRESLHSNLKPVLEQPVIKKFEFELLPVPAAKFRQHCLVNMNQKVSAANKKSEPVTAYLIAD